MIYRITYPDVILQFNGNACQAFVDNADSPAVALAKTRAVFRYIRDESIDAVGKHQYLIYFRVVHDFRIPLTRHIERTLRTLNSKNVYESAPALDKYIVTMIARYTGKPFWLVQQVSDLRDEVTVLRNSAIAAREVESMARFVDWDICIHNYIELNLKVPAYRSRVIRNVGK